MASLSPAEALFKNPVEHVYAASPGGPLPAESRPEIAFVGRSNVGKSSLINLLLGRTATKVARVSNTPGATRAIHFYAVGEPFFLVDLPGYGYAKMSRTLSAEISAYVTDYLTNRRSLKMVCVLVDARHGFKDSDRAMIDVLAQAGVSVLVTLTKGDKVPLRKQPALLRWINDELAGMIGPTGQAVLTSTVKGDGLPALRKLIYDNLNEGVHR